MADTLPIAVLPIHDPDAVLLPYLEAMGPDLSPVFSSVLLGVTAGTLIRQPEHIQRLRDDPLFHVQVHGQSIPVGSEFRALYTLAASANPPDQHLHLCFPDRVAFALGTHHRPAFLSDITAVRESELPLLFQRSETAWRTHPANYRQLEGLITTVGELLFARSLDFAWCHLVVTAGQLAAKLPDTRRRDMSFLAEIIVLLQDRLTTREVDWLAWEDPFIYGRDPHELKTEMEADPAEVRKRLSYVLPMLEVLSQAAA